jgi:prepilin-type processing-associated H-X9-DG protein
LNSTLGAEFAVAADLNPGGERMLKLSVRSPAKEMLWGNSTNHNRDGQNVLYGDGHVVFESTPFVGVILDNIYTFGESGGVRGEKGGGKGIVGSPVGPEDSILLPTAEDLGVTDKDGKLSEDARRKREGMAYEPPPAAKDLAAFVQKIAGDYVRDDGKGHQLSLNIAAERIIFTGGDGKTQTIPFRIANLIEGGANLTIDRAGGLQSDTIAVWPEGNVMFVAGDVQLAGRWMKK